MCLKQSFVRYIQCVRIASEFATQRDPFTVVCIIRKRGVPLMPCKLLEAAILSYSVRELMAARQDPHVPA